MSANVTEMAFMGGAGGVFGLVVGVLIVAVLIGAFVLGSRRKEREPPPPLTREYPDSPRADPDETADDTRPLDRDR